MAKKIKSIFVVFLSLIVLSSCSVLGGFIGGSDVSAMYAVEDGNSESIEEGQSLDANYFQRISLAVSDSSYYVTTESLVIYDPEMFTLLTDVNEEKTEEAYAEFKLSNDDGMVKVVVDDPYVVLRPINKTVGNTTVTIECLSNVAKFSKPFTFNINIVEPNIVEMADEGTTRLYGILPAETLEAVTLDNLKVRGILWGEQDLEVDYSSLNATSHEYKASVSVLGEYADCIVPFFGTMEEPLLFTEYKTSNKGTTIRFSIWVDLVDLTKTESYKNREDVTFQLTVLDKTDGVYYTGTFSYPIITFEDSMSDFTEFVAATNGTAGAPALVGTKVQVDARMEAFSEFDRFNNVKVVITDPDFDEVMNSHSYVSRNGEATVGTIGGGWGETELFSSNRFSFVPEKAGTYTARVYGYDDNGYNLCREVYDFEVVQ